jgi:uncharacterized protein YecE (DUF72 family)
MTSASTRSPRIVYVGTAGWVVPASERETSAGDSHLKQYAASLNAVEINSSFHRHHRRETYERWTATVPSRFRFAVKLPKAITHDGDFKFDANVLERFAGEVQGLGAKLAVILVQFPPRLQFESRKAARFFRTLQSNLDALIACEPRHSSWGAERASDLLARYKIARVAADPAPWNGAGEPGGWPGLIYYRQHGSPRRYYSKYADTWLHQLNVRLKASTVTSNWCMFDNTVLGHAYANAKALHALMGDDDQNV